MAAIIVVSDDCEVQAALADPLSEAGHRTFERAIAEDALSVLSDENADVLVLDWDADSDKAGDLLQQAQEMLPSLVVVLLVGSGQVAAALETIGDSSVTCLIKPPDPQLLRHTVTRALEEQARGRRLQTLEAEHDERFRLDGIIGASRAMQEALDVAERAAGTDSPVLLAGEVGTGRRLLARAIHRHGARRDRGFIVAQMAGLSESLLMSELSGRLARANRGTLLVADVESAPMSVQSALLQLLETGRVGHPGARRTGPFDVRAISTSSGDLEEAVKAGLFRQDLYYRLTVLPIALPPLRRRQSDIPLLAARFLDRFSRRLGREKATLSEEALESLSRYSWPGNVRELESVIERAVILGRAKVIQPEDLPSEVRAGASGVAAGLEIPDEGLKLDEVERDLIRAALQRTQWNQTRAAELIGLTRKTLMYRMKKHGIGPPKQKNAR